jgi:rRNA maturation endonuclease Nob1
MGLFRRKTTIEVESERCPLCGERLPDEADECAMCGADLRPLRPSLERMGVESRTNRS